MAKQVYLVFGDDDLQVGQKAREIVDANLPGSDRALGLERINGAVDTIEPALIAISAVVEALQTRSFLGGGKLVWLEDCRFLADVAAGKTAAVKEKLESLNRLIQTGLIPGHVLLVTAPAVDKRFAFYKACLAVGELHPFAIPDQPQQAEKFTRERLRDWLQTSDLRMSENVRQRFVERVGSDTRQLVNELEKLNTYLGQRREATEADIEAITSSSKESVAWDLTDAFGNRDLVKALGLLHRLLFQQEAPMALMSMIGGRIRELLIYREAIDRGWLRSTGGGMSWAEVPDEGVKLFEEHFARDPRKVHPFRAQVLVKQAQKFSVKELYQCLARHAATQEALVTTSRDPGLAMEFMLIRMLRRPAPRPAVAATA